MNRRKSLALSCITLSLALTLVGCKPDSADTTDTANAEAAPVEETAPAVDPAATAGPIDTKAVEPPTPVPGTDAAIVEDRSSPVDAAPSFDAKAFAGRYAAGDTALEVTADGMFSLSTGGTMVDGTWTLQPGGKKITLDPNSKGEQDRILDVVSADSIKLAGVALKRVADQR